MEGTCNICLSATGNIVKLNDLFVEDMNGGVYFADLLKDLLLQDFSAEETANICELCTSSVLSYVSFKQRITKNLQPKTLQRMEDLKCINQFLDFTNEPVLLMNCFLNSLLLLPTSQKEFVGCLVSQVVAKLETNPAPHIETFENEENLPPPALILGVDDEDPIIELSKDEDEQHEKSQPGKFTTKKTVENASQSEVYQFLRAMDNLKFQEVRQKLANSVSAGMNKICTFCCQGIHKNDLLYHTISQHYMAEDPTKEWLKENISAGRIAGNKRDWRCVFCESVLTYSGLRVHLLRHLEKALDLVWNEKLADPDMKK